MQAGEENRLLYVGMTRAKSHMVLSYSTNEKRKPGPWARLITQQLVQARDPLVSITTTSAAPEPMQAHLPMPSCRPTCMPIVPAGKISTIPRRQSRISACFRNVLESIIFRDISVGKPARRTFIDIEDMPRVDAGELEASEIGTQVHKILGGIPIDEPAGEAVELADRFLTSDLGKRALRATHIGREYDFLVSIDGLVLRGQIDLWFEQNRELILIDYKTDQARKPIDLRRVHSYALQLQLYAIALEQIAGRPVTRAYLHFLRPNEVVDVDLSPLQLNAAREHVRAFITAQDALDYPLSTGDHCFRCEYYKEICPARRSLAIAVSRS